MGEIEVLGVFRPDPNAPLLTFVMTFGDPRQAEIIAQYYSEMRDRIDAHSHTGQLFLYEFFKCEKPLGCIFRDKLKEVNPSLYAIEKELHVTSGKFTVHWDDVTPRFVGVVGEEDYVKPGNNVMIQVFDRRPPIEPVVLAATV